MVCFIGQMAENTKENGKMVNNMVLEFIHQHQEKQRKGNGLKVKELTGFEKFCYRSELIYNVHSAIIYKQILNKYS